MSDKDDRRWMRNTLEVIINHYKELEEELQQVRNSYEVELLRLECEDAIRELTPLE